ncbi:MAG: HDOD domain-containing protein [Candidatus Hydrogenedentes bacterium]|nr:HDOD domain-containing protein [Candidatus Hydrogenedentota bacterium]
MPMTPAEIEKRVESLSNLPTLPGIVKVLTSMVENSAVAASDIGEVIAKDQVLSARLLRLVNSPVYGFPGRISSVTHAIVLLGFNVVKGLVLGAAVFDSMAGETQGLWEHSLGCAVISRRIAKERRMKDPEEIMVAGLLHDLGKVVLAYLEPAGYADTRQTAYDARLHISAAEREVFGVDHAHVASWIARHWRLPLRLSDPLVYHHAPSRAVDFKDATAVVHLADILARGMGYGYPGDMTMPLLDHDAFHAIGLSFLQIDRILEESETEYRAGVDVLARQGIAP